MPKIHSVSTYLRLLKNERFDADIRDVKIIEPTIFEDERGYFFEAYNAKKFEEFIGFRPNFCQTNESFSKRGTIRGLHLQKRATCPVESW